MSVTATLCMTWFCRLRVSRESTCKSPLRRFVVERTRPFYDDYEKGAMRGKDLYEHLDWIYQKAARDGVLFTSKDYAEKVWTTTYLRTS
jgi:hypothetical protein